MAKRSDDLVLPLAPTLVNQGSDDMDAGTATIALLRSASVGSAEPNPTRNDAVDGRSLPVDAYTGHVRVVAGSVGEAELLVG